MKLKTRDQITDAEIEVELDSDQEAVFRAITEGDKYQFYKLSGPAGCGKSFMINILRHFYGAYVCATTARAALNVGGSTLDSLFCINRTDWKITNKNFLARNMAACPEIIIIDEASMIGEKMAKLIYDIAKEYGKTIIFVGDWAQAMPVKDAWPLESPLFTTECKVLKLEINHRQGNGPYLEALKSIRNGQVTDAISEMFLARVSDPPSDDRYIRLYATNAAADKYNSARLNELTRRTNNILYKVTSSVVFGNLNYAAKVTEEQMDKIIDDANYAHNESFCEGARVILTQNTGSFINSDTGVIKSISLVGGPTEYDEEGFPTRPIEVSSFVVTLDRNKMDVEVMRTTKSSKDPGGTIKHSVMGFPIRLGWAITIHKAQGMTVDKAYLDMDSLSAFNAYPSSKHGLAYVGLSRTRTLDGLLISSWRPANIYFSPEVTPLL